MDAVPGSVGTGASFSLRLGQTAFSSASLLFMSLGVEFYSYTAFWGLDDFEKMGRLDLKICGIEFCWDLGICSSDGWIVKNLIFVPFLPNWCPIGGYLVTVMGLVIPWSFTLALVDGYSVLVKCPLRQPGILAIIVVGDWVLSLLTLAAACSTASVVDILLHLDSSYCPSKLCRRYQISAAMAFFSWFLSFASSLFNLWLLPSL